MVYASGIAGFGARIGPSSQLDAIEQDCEVQAQGARAWARRLAPWLAALSVVGLVIFVTLVPRGDPSLLTVEQVWGKAPYGDDVRYFAERCISGGPLPERCEEYGVWMEGAHASSIYNAPEPSAEMVDRAWGRRARGVTYLRRLATATLAGEGPLLNSLRLGWGRTIVMLGLLAGLGGALGMWGWARRRGPLYRITVSASVIRVGGQRIPVEELLACEIKGDALVLRLTRSRMTTTPALGLTPNELDELVESIRPLILSSDERRERARLHMEVVRGRRDLAGRAKS